METPSPTVLVGWLRAAGEPSRLRLLALCGPGGLSVSDLAAALGQSEPRVSRHLRILTEAGLIERERRGQWVHYRVVREPRAASFIAGLLGQLDRRDATLAADRRAARAALAPEAAGSGESRLGRALAGFVARDLAAAHGPALVVGVSHPELLAAATAVQPCTVIAHSRRAAQGARSFAARHSLRCRVLESSGGASLGDADVAHAGGPFGTLVLDQPGAKGDSLSHTLAAVRRALQPHAHVWIFERYEALESAHQRVVEHPLARLRRLLTESGLRCERLSPLEADGEHVLAALAHPVELQAAPQLTSGAA